MACTILCIKIGALRKTGAHVQSTTAVGCSKKISGSCLWRHLCILVSTPFRWPPAWFMSLCELVSSPLAVLFCFVLFCFYWYVSPSLHLAVCLLPCTGWRVVRASPSIGYLCCILFFHLARRVEGSGGLHYFSDLFSYTFSRYVRV